MAERQAQWHDTAHPGTHGWGSCLRLIPEAQGMATRHSSSGGGGSGGPHSLGHLEVQVPPSEGHTLDPAQGPASGSLAQQVQSQMQPLPHRFMPAAEAKCAEPDMSCQQLATYCVASDCKPGSRMHGWGSCAVCHPHTVSPTVPMEKLRAPKGQLHSNVLVHDCSHPQLRPNSEFEGQHCCSGSMHWPEQSTWPVQHGKHGNA